MARSRQRGAGSHAGRPPAEWLLAAWEQTSDALIILDESLGILHANPAARGLLEHIPAAGSGVPWPPAVAIGFQRLVSGEFVTLKLAAATVVAQGAALPGAPHRAALVRLQLWGRWRAGVAADRALLPMYRLALKAPGFAVPWNGLLKEAARAVRAGAVLWVVAAGETNRLERWHGRLPGDPSTWSEPAGGGLFGPAIRTGITRCVPDLKGLRRTPDFLAAAGMRAVLVVPVLVAGHIDGALAFLSPRPRGLTGEGRRRAGIAAECLGMAIENERLSRYLEGTGGRSERERLAAELHDGLVQDLYGLQLLLETVTEQVPTGAGDLAAVVDRVRQVADRILAEARRTIAELHEGGELAQGLLPALRATILQLGREAGMQARLEGAERLAALDLPRPAKVQVLRILQEALANVRKHARATRVTLGVAEFPSYYRFTCADNGVGFDPKAVAEGHFGLQFMRERASSVDGLVTVESEPGKGTRLVLFVPRPAGPAAAGAAGPLLSPGGH